MINLQSQIKIAGGATLDSMGIGTQEDVGAPLGYALQCRITAEDPSANFQVWLYEMDSLVTF